MCSIDNLLGLRYDKNTYNCAHFVVDAWFHVTGSHIRDKMSNFLFDYTSRRVDKGLQRSFIRHVTPVSPCIVLLRRRGVTPHVGMYYKGKVLHITEIGVHYVPLSTVSRGYTSTRFYT